MIETAADPDDRWLYRVGGVCSLGIGLAYLAIFPLFSRVGTPPTGGEAWLKYLDGKTTVWWAILGLSVLTDLLFVPVALSLYQALNRINRSAMLLATAFVGLFVVLDLAVTWTNYASLLTLRGLYAVAADDVQRAACIAAANYASAVLASPTEVLYAIVNLSLGIFIIGCVMLQRKRVFGRITACLAVGAGLLGLVSAAGFFLTMILNAVLVTLWVLWLGVQLCRFGWRKN